MTDEKKKTGEGEKGVTRRQFITSMGTAAAVAAVSGRVTAAAEKEQAMLPAEKLSKITLLINGRRYKLAVEPRWSLLYVLRERIGLTGTKVGCERGECGACTVLIDGKSVYSCTVLAIDAQGRDIQTIEGLAPGNGMHPVSAAFVNNDAQQCGYCTAGFVMAVKGFLGEHPNPTMEDVKHGLGGNLCRCGTYMGVRQAALEVAAATRMKGGKNG